MNDNFLKACRGEAVDRTPVWIMRQAGRYLPQYMAVREKVSFLELCKTPELACEVTIQPVDCLGVDAAILFSDILIPLEPMGMELTFHENRGPVFANPVKNTADVARLRVPDPTEDLPFVLDAVRLLRRELAGRVPLIGFAGAPFTLATYLIEGGSSKTFFDTKKMMYTAPELYATLLDKITDCTLAYLKAQAEAGAQALQLFDSWAGVLGPDDFAAFALPYAARIIQGLKETGVPLIYFVNNGATLIALAETSGADVLGMDWRPNLDEAARLTQGRVALQGNLDPCALLLPEDALRKRVVKILAAGKKAKGHVFNLGHGILPQIPPEKARLLVELVHELGSA